MAWINTTVVSLRCKRVLFMSARATYSDESAPDLLQAGALLHADDSDVVLLVDPDDEVLGLVHEDASADLQNSSAQLFSPNRRSPKKQLE